MLDKPTIKAIESMIEHYCLPRNQSEEKGHHPITEGMTALCYPRLLDLLGSHTLNR